MRMIFAVFASTVLALLASCSSSTARNSTASGKPSTPATGTSEPSSPTTTPLSSAGPTFTPEEEAYLAVAAPLLNESDADAIKTGGLICEAFQVRDSYADVRQAASGLQLSSTDMAALTRASVTAFCASEQPALEASLASSQIHRLGAHANTRDGKITIFSVRYPYPASEDAANIKDSGKDFAVADIKVCPTITDADYSNFQLTARDARTFTFWNVQIGAKDPNLTDSLSNPSPGTCVRGYLTFEVTHGEKLRTISYVDTEGNATKWAV